MIRNFVTYLNNLFLPQLINLVSSLDKHAGPYCLWVVCLDDTTFDLLKNMSISNVKPLLLSDFENHDLLKVKAERTFTEYCWTLTPFVPQFVFDSEPSVKQLTYLDADLFIIGDLNKIYSEFEASTKAVLITEHAFTPKYDLGYLTGVFCVQFLVFERDRCQKVLSWWQARCIEWCFNRFENGKFGDQKYLDDWPKVFSDSVHVLKDKSLALGPWNVNSFPFSSASFYHCHGVRILDRNTFYLGDYEIPETVMKFVLSPYLENLKVSISLLEKAGWDFAPQAKPVSKSKIILAKIKNRFLRLRYALQGNVVKL